MEWFGYLDLLLLGVMILVLFVGMLEALPDLFRYIRMSTM